jgi:hypothetical protein
MLVQRLLLRTASPFSSAIRYHRTKSAAKVLPSSAKLSTISTASPAAQLLPLIPHGSQHHTSLPTFLAHAARTSLSPTSPLFIGTHYEYTVLCALSAIGFTLTRTGRSSDNGIDLLGTWTVPSHPAPLRVLLQCKNHSRSLRPEHVRELEGAFPGAPAGWKGQGVMGFLVSPKEASRGVRDAVARSKLPLGFLMVKPIGQEGLVGDGSLGEGNEGNEGKVLQFLWNQEAAQCGLEGLGVTMRYGEDPGMKEVALTWNGWAIKKTEAENSGSLEKLSLEKDEPVKRKRGRPRKDEGAIVIAKKVTPEADIEAPIPARKKVTEKLSKPRGQRKKS